MSKSLAHRQSIPIMVTIPDDPDAIRLFRLIVTLLDFIWQHKYTVLLLVDNVNQLFDLAEAFLDICAACYDGYEWLLCNLKLELSPLISNYT